MLVKEILAGHSLSNFQGIFQLAANTHHHNTRHADKNTVALKQRQTHTYGTYSIEHQAASNWNTLQNLINIDLLQESYSKTKEILTTHFLNSYEN